MSLRYIDIAAKYSANWLDGNKRLSDEFPTVAAAKDALPWAYKYWNAAGMSDATFMATYLGCAIAQDAARFEEAPNNLTSGYLNAYNYADWSKAVGKWKMNRSVPIPRGGMEGASSFWYAGQGSDHGMAATEFVMDDADWWPLNQTERRVFETPNSGLDGANNMSYNESFRVERILVSGPGKFGDGINRIGILFRRGGECTWVNQVRTNDFQRGFVAIGGVPLTCGTITSFGNEFQGFLFAGSALSTLNIQTLSGDDNAELFAMRAAYDGAPGGRANIGLLKSEGGITAGHTFRNQVAARLDGQYVANIGIVSFANKPPSVPEAMFVVDPRLPGGAGQKSLLRVGGCIGFGYSKLLVNKATGRSWSSSGDYSGVSFEHYASGDRLITNASGVNASDGTPTTPVDPPVNPPVDPPVNPPTVLTFTPLSPLKDGTVEGVLREARFAVDGNPSTFWISDRSMANGQAVEVSFPSRSVAGITFTTGRYNNSYPRTYTVDYWTGSAWSRLGSYTGGVTSAATWSAKTTTKIKITCTTANGNWFAINELSVK